MPSCQRRSNISAVWIADLRVAVLGEATIGEGPLWCPAAQHLRWIDVPAGTIHGPNATSPALALPPPIGCIAVHAAGGLLAATSAGILHVRADDAVPAQVAHPLAGREAHRYNDGACDSRGRLWVGSMRRDGAAGHGALHVVEPNGATRLALEGLALSNGIGWSPDGTEMYHADSNLRTLRAYPFDPVRGTLGRSRLLARLEADDAKPDGLAVDAEGFIWLAMWDGATILRISPSGAIERAMRLPVPRPTSCCFGGDLLRTLFVTTARHGLSAATLAAAPLSGSVLAVELPVMGVPRHAFGG